MTQPLKSGWTTKKDIFSHPQYLRFDELSEEREASSLFDKQSVLLGLAEGPEGVGPAAGNLCQRPGIET